MTIYNQKSPTTIFLTGSEAGFSFPPRLPDQSSTSIKINDASCWWIGNDSRFVQDFKNFIEHSRRLEQARHADESSPPNFDAINLAESLVQQASNAFSQLKSFNAKISRLKNDIELGPQPHTEQIAGILDNLTELQIKSDQLKLPEILTAETVKKYGDELQSLLENLKQRFEGLNIPPIERRSDVVATEKVSYCIISGATPQETLHLSVLHSNESLESLLEMIEIAEVKLDRHPELAESIKKIKEEKEVSKLRKCAPIKPFNNDAVFRYGEDADRLSIKLRGEIENLYALSKKKIAEQMEGEKKQRLERAKEVKVDKEEKDQESKEAIKH